MKVIETAIPDLLIIEPRVFGDDRGFFMESWNAATFREAGLDLHFVQDNHSRSAKGVLRGLHFQTPTFAQAKLVRCVRGRIFDVAVDVRRGSPTYGRYVSAELTADNGAQLYMPVGFAHAFMTLEPDTEVMYKVTAFYAPQNDGGLRYDDPDIAVAWPLPAEQVVLSPKDAELPLLRDFLSPFDYDGDPLTLTEL